MHWLLAALAERLALILRHAEHEVVVRAILSGDPARAHAAMLHHLGQAGAAFEEIVSREVAVDAGRVERVAQ